jgi:hypothetical protein
MEQFKIDYYFNLYKDKAIKSAELFRNYMKFKYKITDPKLLNKIYLKINNYQVERYGTNITKGCIFAKEMLRGVNCE